MPDAFAPTLTAAAARIAAVRPADYARTRNALDGAVTGLSPYITHGLVTLPDVLAGVASRHALPAQHRFVFELGWREYFRHVWSHRGDGILRSLHEGPLPDEAYARELPADIRAAATGVPAIDEAVRTLHASGMLHNHARMWLASYVVHLRKVHWRAGADWLYGHLLDGDLASNHLSWQWVAGTGNHKPYLFNADNVARYAPASWHSPGSVIDTPYEMLERMARDPASASRPGGVPRDLTPLAEPLLHDTPPIDLGLSAPDAALVAGRDVWLVHPWSLGALPAGLPPEAVVLGVFVADFHRAWPWSERRWRFVGRRMAELAGYRWFGDAAAIGAALAGARSVRAMAEPHLAPWLLRWAECRAAPTLFAPVERRCDSFSKWWSRVSKGIDSAAELLGRQQPSREQ
ncbi:FAD-binding domain-containing protein [Azohydromonas aeria]|uniref:FAD-binding domain-containing protein n=1 Tax=Azohydromonas aeria TaxID=2590212 RepID=UPI0012FA82FF|nr:FAD-binding domain-containing protein [Azohydromonas aeria]